MKVLLPSGSILDIDDQRASEMLANGTAGIPIVIEKKAPKKKTTKKKKED